MTDFFCSLIIMHCTGYSVYSLFKLKYKYLNPLVSSFLIGYIFWGFLFMIPNLFGKTVYQYGDFIVLLQGFFLTVGSLMAVKNLRKPENKMYFGYIAAVMVFMIILGIMSAHLGALGFDTRVFWILKSKVLHYYGTYATDDFLNTHRLNFHSQYPLFSCYIDYFFNFSKQEFDDRTVTAVHQYMIFLIFLVLLSYDTKNSRQYPFSALFFISLPLVYMGMIYPYNDHIIAFAVAVLFLMFEEHSTLVRSAVFAAALAMLAQLKNEGMVLAGLLGVLFVFHHRLRIKNIIILGITFMAGYFPWFIIKKRIPLFLDDNYTGSFTLNTLTENYDRFVTVPVLMFREFFRIGYFGFFWIFFIAAAGYFIRKKHWNNLPKSVLIRGGALIGAYNAVLFVVYYTSHYVLKDHIESSYVRLILQTFPVSCIIAGSMMNTILRMEEKE